ncbi:MAG: hypothetical protein R3D32_13220 [Nitratireductor sp.]
MGRLEFIVKEGKWVTAKEAQAKRERFGSDFEFHAVDPEAEARSRRARLDCCLTWASYYVLVYASACIFLPAQAAQAFEVLGSTVSRTTGILVERQPESYALPSALLVPRQFEAEQWPLRGSSDID